MAPGRGQQGRTHRRVDGQVARDVERGYGVEGFLAGLRAELKARRFAPLPVRERLIPKPGGKLRRRGIATIRDRVVQAACKLVLEPIWEADLVPCSYGFRPGRRAQDAIQEIRSLAARSYGWVLEADITACFDEIDHTALMAQVRRRVGTGGSWGWSRRSCRQASWLRTAPRKRPQRHPARGILSPLLSNLALSVLDEHAAGAWQAMAPSPNATIGASEGRPPGGWSATRTTVRHER